MWSQKKRKISQSLLLLLLVSTPLVVQAQPLRKTSAPPNLIQQAISENAAHTVLPEQVTISTVQKPGQNLPLYILNFNDSSLCGATGCLYVGYIPNGNSFKQVFGIHLIQNNSISPSNKMQNGLPCLDFSFPPGLVATWCYNGSKYEIFK